MTKMTQWVPITMRKMTNNDNTRREAIVRAQGVARRSGRVIAMSLTLALTAIPALTFATYATAAQAQDKPSVRRTVHGKVEGSNSAALKGAVVYLKDSRTLAVKSFLSDDEGMFHFGQLSTNTDYELYAEFEGKRSKSKTISSFDSKADLMFTLRVDAS